MLFNFCSRLNKPFPSPIPNELQKRTFADLSMISKYSFTKHNNLNTSQLTPETEMNTPCKTVGFEIFSFKRSYWSFYDDSGRELIVWIHVTLCIRECIKHQTKCLQGNNISFLSGLKNQNRSETSLVLLYIMGTWAYGIKLLPWKHSGYFNCSVVLGYVKVSGKIMIT